MAKNLILYYSRKGENYWNGSIRNLPKGNTEIVAEFIQKAVGGDLFEIETVKSYIKDHMKMIYEAKEELEKGIRPELKNYPDISGYDTIFLGFPNWWDTLPMPVVGFLEHYDWSGKRIIPFVTSGGSGFGRSIADLQKICAGAIIEKGGGAFLGHEVETSEAGISAWAKSVLG